jgi:hypothetical protein
LPGCPTNLEITKQIAQLRRTTGALHLPTTEWYAHDLKGREVRADSVLQASDIRNCSAMEHVLTKCDHDDDDQHFEGGGFFGDEPHNDSTGFNSGVDGVLTRTSSRCFCAVCGLASFCTNKIFYKKRSNTHETCTQEDP